MSGQNINKKMSGSNVSVIIPAYNSARFIEDAIKSALLQSLPPREIIVIDDGSVDDTAKAIKRFPAVQYIYQEHRGVSAARNKGIESAACEWIAFLDSDDIWFPGHLEKVISLIGKYGLVWACGEMKVISSKGREIKMARRWKKLLANGDIFNDFFAAFAAQAHFLLSAIVVRKDVLFEAGLFDEWLNADVDYDLFFRIADRYPKIGFVWPETVYRRIREGSISYGKRINGLLLLRKHRRLFTVEGTPGSRGRQLSVRYLLRESIIAAVETQDRGILRDLLSEEGGLLKGLKFYLWIAMVFPFSALVSLGLMKIIKRNIILLFNRK